MSMGGEGLPWLIGVVVCLPAALQIQLFAIVDLGVALDKNTTKNSD